MVNMSYIEALARIPDILIKDLDQNLCTCNDVVKMDVIKAIADGANTLEEVKKQTCAADGNGCCARQVERLIECISSSNIDRSGCL